jgi:hypothetical protein
MPVPSSTVSPKAELDFQGQPHYSGLNPPSQRFWQGANERSAPDRVSTSDEPGGVRLLWCLRRRATDVRCVLMLHAAPIEVHVLQDRDLVLREVFTDEGGALNWAAAYADRLKQHGWRDSPVARSPSSAA